MLNITTKFDDRQVKRALRKVGKQVRRSKSVMKEIGKREVKKAQQRIKTTKTDPEGRRWAPWSYETLKARQREGNAGRGLLYKSGNLLRRFKYKVSRRKLTITNTAPYAKYLQEGRNRMPARRFLGWDGHTTKNMTNRFRRWINRGWK